MEDNLATLLQCTHVTPVAHVSSYVDVGAKAMWKLYLLSCYCPAGLS